MNINRYQKSVVAIILCLFLVSTLSSCSCGKGFGISTSSSKSVSKNSISMRFNVFKDDMTKEIDLNDVTDEITFYYSGFRLEKGAFVFQLYEDQELLSEKKISSGDASRGSVSFDELNSDIEYSVKIFAEEALEGNIKIKW